MRIQIDTNSKIIRLDQKENIGALYDFLVNSVENWREYVIDAQTVIYNWVNPVYVYPWWQYPTYSTPGILNNPSTIVVNSTSNGHGEINSVSEPFKLNASSTGTFNVDLN